MTNSKLVTVADCWEGVWKTFRGFLYMTGIYKRCPFLMCFLVHYNFSMKSFASGLASLSSTLGLLTLNFAVSLPAQAAIVCESGTISNYQNGSLASCMLGQDKSLQISNPHSGIFNLICKAKNYISFDDKGQFTSCQLAVEIEIRKGNSLEKCPAEYRVNVSVTNDSNLSISCQPY